MEDLAAVLDELCRRTMAGWAANPDLPEVDAGRESSLLSGGYSDRQIAELVQNAADAALHRATARIELRLTSTHLYAANTGDPVSPAGLRALINGDLSPKGGEEVGRFGLGFRSLLRLGGRVDMHSGGIAFRFDPVWCAAEARRAAKLPPEVAAPGFRLAQRLDAAAEAARDSVLRELLGWADTVIRAELSAPDAAEAMRREMERFPAEFLLFPSPDIQLDIVLPDHSRRLRRRRRGQVMRVSNGESATTWRLFQERFAIDDEAARRDAGRLQARDSVTITWAIPAKGTLRAGQFWNAFPTRTGCIVPGILDARWKLNSDRTALTGEAWNAALMRCAARLIARSLPTLATRKDPGRPLDALPRELERRDDPAAPLHDASWGEVRNAEFLADGTGRLRRPAELCRAPSDAPELQKRWEDAASEADKALTVHHACAASRDRAARLERLAEALNRENDEDAEDEREYDAAAEAEDPEDEDDAPLLQRWSAERWLEAIASPHPAVGREAVLLTAELVDRKALAQYRVRSLIIVPSQEGSLAAAGELVLPGSVVPTGRKAVHPDLVADSTALDVLSRVFRIGTMDDAAWRALLDEAWPSYGAPGAEACEAGWKLILSAPEDVGRRFVSEHGDRLRCLTRSGEWRRREEVLLPGRLLKENEADLNPSVLVDPAFAERAASVLSDLGVSDLPAPRWGIEGKVRWNEPTWLIARDREADAAYRERRKTKTTPQWGTLGYLRPVHYPAGLPLLLSLRGVARARLTRHLLDQLSEWQPILGKVGGRGSGPTEARYPPIDAPDPVAWFIWKEGCELIGNVPVSLVDIAALRRGLAAEERPVLRPLLPDDSALRCRWAEGWPEPAGVEKPVWLALLDPCVAARPSLRQGLWEAAARRGYVPDQVPIGTEEARIPLASIMVTTNSADLPLADKAELPCVQLAQDAAEVWIAHGAKDARRLIVTNVIGEPSDWIASARYIPGLAEFVADDGPIIGFVDAVVRRLGRASEAGDLVCDADRLLVSREWLRTTPWNKALRQLLEAIASRVALSAPIEQVFAALDRSEIDRRRAEVRAEADLAHRLLKAIRSSDALRDRLPPAARAALHELVSEHELASLFLDVHGSAALRRIEDELRDAGLAPPARWGTDEARRFVLSLGFPLNFAGAARPKLPAEELVVGPRPLPPLHDYQEAALRELSDIFASPEDRRRAVLSLPTGAGKTRVAVEAAVGVVLSRDQQRPLVLWVAQTEELGEQAVQGFRDVWRAKGEPDGELRIARLWDGQPTPPDGEGDRPTVVVTLIQTARTRISQGAVPWLRESAMVIIDESHHGIAPSYTEILGGLGFSTGQRRARDREPMLLGLTATPFRSHDEEGSRRLAQRFDCQVVPRDQVALYQTLRQRQILADVVMEPIVRSEPFDLTAEDLAYFEKFEDLPAAALERLSMQPDRNEAILRTLEEAPERSVLLFANSVAHATQLTAHLSLRGIRARVVSADTDLSARRDSVAAFRRGEVRVICNAAVFTTGFDAPGVEMVLIARPVFSPVRFMQMVGRGLRGPKNGGTARCRVVTVRDNIDVYKGHDPLEWWRRYYA